MELEEAQLFRMLTDLFGRDQVLFRMSALTVCGGQVNAVPRVLRDGFATASDLSQWAAGETCLFTIVDREDSPKLVVEFAEEFRDIVDPLLVEHHRILPTLLEEAGIRYVTILRAQLHAMLDPKTNYNLVMMLEGVFGDGGEEDEQ